MARTTSVSLRHRFRPRFGLRTLLAAVLLCAVAFGLVRRSRPPGIPPVSREQAIEILSSTETFVGILVGDAAEPSDQALAFVTILRQGDADAIFKDLLKRAKLAGQLYALCGLYFTDHEAFLESAEEYRGSHDSVMTHFGCLGWWQEVADIMESPSPGAVRLRDLKDSVKDWIARNNVKVDEEFALDIIGGGYPDMFRRFASKVEL